PTRGGSEQWEATCKAAGISEELHFHDIRGTTVTMLFRAGCSIGEIVTITGHTLRRAQEILDKYLARTSQLAETAIGKLVVSKLRHYREVRERLGNRFCKTARKTR